MNDRPAGLSVSKLYVDLVLQGVSVLCRRRGPVGGRGVVRVGLLASMLSQAMAAETVTADPETWRSLSYADLQHPSPATSIYADIWADAIRENNEAYAARGDNRFANGNAPVTEAHFVIWSSRRSVVLSLLNTATGCTLKGRDLGGGTSIKLCPLRIAIYDGLLVRTLDGGRGCVLEVARASGTREIAAVPTAYASYDTAARTVRVGVIVDHQPVAGCSLTIPLPSP